MLPVEASCFVASSGVMGTADNNLELLRAAIARRAGVVLSLPVAGAHGPELRHFKTHFLADAGDGFWVESVPAEAEAVQQLVERREPAGVCFRSGHLKVMFAAQVLHHHAEYAVGPTGPIEALLLRFPAASDVRATPRRKTYRVPVPPNSDLVARVWVVSEDAHLRDKPPAKAELRCDLFDISVAGLGLIVHGAGGKAPAVAAGDRVRVHLTMREATVLIEGRLRYPPKPVKEAQGSVRAGVQFKTLGDTRDEREAKIQLDRMVGEIQRESIRRKKLGVA